MLYPERDFARDKRIMRTKPGIIVILTALVVRIAWSLLIPVIPVSDSVAYDKFASNIAAGDGYGWEPSQLSAYWPVGTSAVYACLYKAFGHGYAPIVVLNILAGTFTVALTMHLTGHWFGRKAALFAGGLLALWPAQIQFSTVLASELLFNLFVLSALTIWLNSRVHFVFQAVTFGALIAAAAYVRPTALLLPAVLGVAGALIIDLTMTKRLRSLILGMVSGLFMLGCFVPWGLRNQQLFGHFVLVSTNGGANFWMGNNPTNPSGTYTELPKDLPTNEVERDRFLKQQAIAYIKANPSAFLVRTIRKLAFLHASETIGVHWNSKGLEQRFGSHVLLPLKLISTIFWVVMLGLALSGIVVLARQMGVWSSAIHPAVLLWVYYAMVHAVIVVQDRYHFPSVPFMAALAGLSLETLTRCQCLNIGHGKDP